jgi:hypothetical protein
MKILTLKQEAENFYALCHLLLGVFACWVYFRIAGQVAPWPWPALIAGIGWELVVDCWLHLVGVSDNRGFSIGDVVFAVIGGIGINYALLYINRLAL